MTYVYYISDVHRVCYKTALPQTDFLKKLIQTIKMEESWKAFSPLPIIWCADCTLEAPAVTEIKHPLRE